MLPPRELRRLGSTAVLLFLGDRLTKALASLLPDEGVFLIRPIIGLKPEENLGIAFSVDLRPLPLTLLVAVLLLVLLVVFSRAVARSDRRTVWPLLLILVGAYGNFLDRIAKGTVTDFLVVTAWPAFNLADVAIVVGASLLIIHAIRKPKTHGSSPAEPG